MRVWIKGGGDIASGVALRLFRCGFQVVMTERSMPSAIRRLVCFSEAVYRGEAQVEEVAAVLVADTLKAQQAMDKGQIPIMVDPAGKIVTALHADVAVDAILAKHNTGTSKNDAPLVIALGPGFTAGIDCHAAIETNRGHTLGRVIYSGSPMANTGIPGEIGGESARRIVRSPADGTWIPAVHIGDKVKAGDLLATAGGIAVTAQIDGILRGILPEGYPAVCGMKSGDIDPRCDRENCFTVSDKALAVGGGVLEAIFALGGGAHGQG